MRAVRVVLCAARAKQTIELNPLAPNEPKGRKGPMGPKEPKGPKGPKGPRGIMKTGTRVTKGEIRMDFPGIHGRFLSGPEDLRSGRSWIMDAWIVDAWIVDHGSWMSSPWDSVPQQFCVVFY